MPLFLNFLFYSKFVFLIIFLFHVIIVLNTNIFTSSNDNDNIKCLNYINYCILFPIYNNFI